MENDKQILTGIQSVLEALKQRRRALYGLHISRKKDIKELLKLAGESGVAVNLTGAEKITRLAGNSKHQGVALECGQLPTDELEDILRYEPADGRDTLVVLTGVDDPRNLGAVARCCSFLGARAMVIPGRSSAPLSVAASRTSAGALESLPVAVAGGITGICQKLEEAGYQVVGVETGGEDMREWGTPADKVALVLGSEDRGLGPTVRSLCHNVVTIPGESPVGSLNLSVAAGIALYHMMAQRK
jgi:23S rRNA (guanosine2251-2'-O)-methyltransferase